MLAIVNHGFEARLRDLRGRAGVAGLTLEPEARDAEGFREAFARGLPERLSAEGLAAARPEPGTGWALARMLGRDYPRNAGAALDAVLQACDPDGVIQADIGLDGEGAPGALMAGQAMLDLAFGLARPEDARTGLPVLVPRGFDVAARAVFPTLGRTVVDFLRPVGRDATGLLMCLGLSERAGDAVTQGVAWGRPAVIGGFVAGLLEGITGKSWDRAAHEAIAVSDCSDAEDFPFLIAGHLCLQMTGPGLEYELPGFGTFAPLVPKE